MKRIRIIKQGLSQQAKTYFTHFDNAVVEFTNLAKRMARHPDNYIEIQQFDGKKWQTIAMHYDGRIVTKDSEWRINHE